MTLAVAAGEIKYYQFEPVHATGYGDSEGNSSESKTTDKLH